jgi:hypothetical protein
MTIAIAIAAFLGAVYAICVIWDCVRRNPRTLSATQKLYYEHRQTTYTILLIAMALLLGLALENIFS